MSDHQATLEDLACQWRAAKAEENSARQVRVEIEEQIVELTGVKKEGSQTHQVGDWKIAVTGKLNRKLDPKQWAEIEHTIPESMRPVEYKPSLDMNGLRYIEQNEPDIYRKIAQAIETKPAKPAVEVK